MVIDIVRRLVAIERAMRDVIIPAIDPKFGNAIEQAGYIVGHLGLMKEQADWDYPFALAELRDYLALAKQLQAINGGDAGFAEAEALAALDVPSLVAIKAQIALVRETCDAQLGTALDGSAAVKSAASEAVLATARLRERRDAAWLQGQGYGMPEGGVVTIAEALSEVEA